MAFLVLADGMLFHGRSVGFNGCVVGEIVFNTSHTGYQEIMTDPSYHGQIITFRGLKSRRPETYAKRKICLN